VYIVLFLTFRVRSYLRTVAISAVNITLWPPAIPAHNGFLLVIFLFLFLFNFLFSFLFVFLILVLLIVVIADCDQKPPFRHPVQLITIVVLFALFLPISFLTRPTRPSPPPTHPPTDAPPSHPPHIFSLIQLFSTNDHEQPIRSFVNMWRQVAEVVEDGFAIKWLVD